MKTFPTNFNAEKNKQTGASPVWMLRCPFPSTGAIYLSDQAFTVAGWQGGITTRPWIASWGQIDEDISGDMVLTKVSDFSVDIIIDPAASPNIDTILWTSANNIETTDCELYLWFLGLNPSTDPPQLMWTGNITDFEKLHELRYSVQMADVSVRLDKYIGQKVSLTTFPNADPDDVGKVLPVLYGSNKFVPALKTDWGVRTTLQAEITNTAASAILTDASRLPASGSVWIDNEKIGYASKSGNTLNSLTRGQDGTTATGHNAGAEAWEHKLQYDSVLANHELRAVNNIYADVGGSMWRVTGGVSAMLSGGRHILRATGQIKAQALKDELGVTQGSHAHGGTKEVRQFCTTTLPVGYSGSWNSSSTTINFPSFSGSRYSVTYRINVSFDIYSDCNNAQGWWRINAGSIKNFAPTHFGCTNSITLQATASDSAERNADYILVGMYHKFIGQNLSGSYWVTSAERIIVTDADQNAATGVDRTGNIIGGVRNVKRFYADAEGYKDTAGGAITGTPNALIERPDHVFAHFLSTYAGIPLANFQTNAAANFSSKGYKFGVVINDYKRLKTWLAYMAWQCRCYFRFSAGKAHLSWRPDSISGQKTITSSMIKMLEDYKTTTRISRTRLDEVINKITIHYNKDWSKTGSEAYTAVSEASDSSSITRYGEKEKPELFNLDFVTLASMADDLRDFYINRYKDRKRLINCQIFLDNSELEFADSAAMQPMAGLLCEIQKANICPGSGQDMRNDTINLLLKEY